MFRRILAPLWITATHRRLLSSQYLAKRAQKLSELSATVPELIQQDRLLQQLAFGDDAEHGVAKHLPPHSLSHSGFSLQSADTCLTAGLLTFALHIEARVASAIGEGFYTIGPCGEEALAAVGLALRSSDAVALHYRHLATSIARGLASGRSIQELALDRARGYTVSSRDPVGGGAHCLLGGSRTDFPVTSTLASQAPPAVGRALGSKLAHLLGGAAAEKCIFPSDMVSYVSLGDGSVNNAHFLSAVNLAEYTRHRGFKCPVVFGISDNDRCISLRGYGWLQKFLEARLGMPVYRCDGNDAVAVFSAASSAITFSRSRGAPAAVVFENLSRRFGHAATDRQEAYLDAHEIAQAAEKSAVAGLCAMFVRESGGGSGAYEAVAKRFQDILEVVKESFAQAAAEPKLTSRDQLLQRNAAAGVTSAATVEVAVKGIGARGSAGSKGNRPAVMRKNMTRAIEEVLSGSASPTSATSSNSDVVYIGEDVEHGGYYLVTEGLKKKFPARVSDFPPDETGLVAAAIGYAQAGLVPICEIPYAKYLDCGGDMLTEAVVMHWLSNGSRPNGMVVRLQGFDKGVFGGNYHTHNMVSTPPGLDVVCFSNGWDWVRGMRHAVRQARAGRVVMVVDSTALLNERHLIDADADNRWMLPYPEDPNDELPFDSVIVYDVGAEYFGKEQLSASAKKVALVTYGNGVRTALQYAHTQAREAKQQKQQPHVLVTVIDSPCISQTPAQLRAFLNKFDAVVFADVCKQGVQYPLAGIAADLHASGSLPAGNWRAIGACNTYNPLGNTSTFLNASDIAHAVESLL